MRTDPVYTPTDCFETFAFPKNLSLLSEIGRVYHTRRTSLMKAKNLSLTDVYNRFHAPGEDDSDILDLRRLHARMDELVMRSYGWADFGLVYGFHPTKHGLRYTIDEPARLEILDRLLALNHERYAEEVAQGLHNKGKNTAKAKVKAPEEHQGLLF